MAPFEPSEDYYMVLGVGQNASIELIIASYKRLALKLHPDRNPTHDTTKDFQLLGQAYDTLKDESKRRHYDLRYPSIRTGCSARQSTQGSRPTPDSRAEALSEAAQIAALQKLKQDRDARWHVQKNMLDSSIFELQREIRRLEQEIKILSSIFAAEAAAAAQKNSWGAWLLSSIYKKVEDSEEEKGRKDRERQERRIEKDMKERRLESRKANLKVEQDVLRKKKEEVDAADLCDKRKIQAIQHRIWAREQMERQEKERVERERLAKIRKEQQEQREKREREEAEMFRKLQAEAFAAELKRHEEEIRRRQQQQQRERREQRRHGGETTGWTKFMRDAAQTHRERDTHFESNDRFASATSESSCRHHGWWTDVRGRTVCPECYEIWPYMLQCPGCQMKACPSCQARIRPKRRNMTRNTRNPPRETASSPFGVYAEYD